MAFSREIIKKVGNYIPVDPEQTICINIHFGKSMEASCNVLQSFSH